MARPKKTPFTEPIIHKRKKKREREEEITDAYRKYGNARKKIRDLADEHPDLEVWEDKDFCKN